MDCKTLQDRAKEIFEIRCECFNDGYLSIESISIDGETVDINSNYYDSCCGDTIHEWCSFPSSLLIATDEDAYTYFQEEFRVLMAERAARLEKQRAEDVARQEQMEIQELIRLLNKYGDIRNEQD
jgi:hypothetical protein